MYRYLFGPVPSRRLGISLGVDLVTHKICSLDCLYCECGETTDLTTKRSDYVPLDDVLDELSHYFSHHPDPDYITFSGSGEPTLNRHIGEVIDFIKREKPAVLVAVLTNGTLLNQPEVRQALYKADLVMPSLDAALPDTFKAINRPHGALSVETYIQGLADFSREYRQFHEKDSDAASYSKGETDNNGLGSPSGAAINEPTQIDSHRGSAPKGKIALEVLILQGMNDSDEDLAALKVACDRIAPDVIQLNTLDRPGAVSHLHAATKEQLEAIQRYLGKENVEIIAAVKDRKEIKSYREDMASAILETIHRRPCTVQDLATVLGSHVNEINKYISDLEEKGKITSVRQDRGLFYHSVKG